MPKKMLPISRTKHARNDVYEPKEKDKKKDNSAQMKSFIRSK